MSERSVQIGTERTLKMQGQEKEPRSWKGAERVNPSEENGNGFILTDLLWNNERPIKVVLVGA